MLDYYKEKIDLLEMQISLAKDGYEKKINELAVALKDVSVEDAEKLIDNIKFAKKAITELESDRDYAMSQYQNELSKPENARKRANDIVFGEQK